MTQTDLDPKGLFQDAFAMEEIDAAQCRSIFLDWALSLPERMDVQTALGLLCAQYAPLHPDHPMTAVLQDGLTAAATPTRRGGWRARPRH